MYYDFCSGCRSEYCGRNECPCKECEETKGAYWIPAEDHEVRTIIDWQAGEIERLNSLLKGETRGQA